MCGWHVDKRVGNDSPGVWHTNHMIHICQNELQQLVSDNGAAIGKSKQWVVREYSSESHGPRMNKGFMACHRESLHRQTVGWVTSHHSPTKGNSSKQTLHEPPQLITHKVGYYITDDLTPCPWTIEIPSLIHMSLRMGSIEKSVGKLLPLKNCTHGM